MIRRYRILSFYLTFFLNEEKTGYRTFPIIKPEDLQSYFEIVYLIIYIGYF